MRLLRQSPHRVCLMSVVCMSLFACVGSGQAVARSLCVGPQPPCFRALQPAIGAARDGDVIHLAPGTFIGGVTIDKSLALVGAGARATTIRGGGPVVTIEPGTGASQPTVALAGLTITGGVTDGDGVHARGGGVEISPARDGSVGATVTIENSVVTGNRARPTSTSPLGPPCPNGPCPFALALGGGIDNGGTLTLRGAIVSDNQAAGVASDADGAGIASSGGALTLIDSKVIGNRALASVPNGRFAEGGGVFIDSGSLTLRRTVVSDNRTSLSSTLPYSFGDGTTIDMNSNSGGIHVGGGVPTTIESSEINRNTTTATDLHGEPLAFDAAMLLDGSPLTMRDSSVDANKVVADVASSADAGPSGSAIELDGGATILRSRIAGNSARVYSPSGTAGAVGALGVFNYDGDPQPVVIRESVIAGNSAQANSPDGSATVQGAGVINNSLLELQDVAIIGNTGRIHAPAGFAQGGGIWNGALLSGPPVELTLRGSVVSHNSLTTNPALDTQGGGLYTTLPVTLEHTHIAENSPDQCSGC